MSCSVREGLRGVEIVLASFLGSNFFSFRLGPLGRDIVHVYWKAGRKSKVVSLVKKWQKINQDYIQFP